ncbi:MAG: hypothetical protein RIQ81_2102 [Pseudomonadota bacterium]|jgi:UDP-N-acetylglucosamine 2-epimerase
MKAASVRKVITVFGTRPEAIKMAPVVKALGDVEGIESKVCVTGQHRDLLDQAMGLFGIEPDFDLKLMKPDQTLFDITSGALEGLRSVLAETRPDLVLVHGDTTTSMVAAVSAFYLRIPVGHVEAGLRSFDVFSPWPEEFNRRTIGSIATLHFAPTERSRQNLLAEKVSDASIEVTGNTVVDAVQMIASRGEEIPALPAISGSRRIVLVTAHRRENFGEPFLRILESLRLYALSYRDMMLVYPVHPNPNIFGPAHALLGDLENVALIPPVDYRQLVHLMRQSQFVLTDSGGIQEEAPTFGKPVIVLRENTERPEAVEAGTAVLVGSDPGKILLAMDVLTDTSSQSYRRMATAINPFGDGKAAKRIVSRVFRALGCDGVAPEEPGLWRPQTQDEDDVRDVLSS